MTAARIPRYTAGQDVGDYLDNLAATLERLLNGRPVTGTYIVTASTQTRTFNSGTATATDTTNFVATLAADLRRGGILG